MSYGTYFYYYQKLKTYFGNPEDSISILKIAYMAGSISTVMTNPFWVVNTHMISN
jgi:hypothetical protein